MSREAAARDLRAILDDPSATYGRWLGRPEHQRLLALEGDDRIATILDALAIWGDTDPYAPKNWAALEQNEELELRRHWRGADAAKLARELARKKLPWTVETLSAAIAEANRWRSLDGYRAGAPAIVHLVARASGKDRAADPALHPALRTLREKLTHPDPGADTRKLLRLLDVLLGEAGDARDVLQSTDAWAAALVSATEVDDRPVLALATGARSAKPSKTFSSALEALVTQDPDAPARAGRLLGVAAAAVPVSRAETPVPSETGDVLRGLCWIAGRADVPESTRRLGAIAIAGWRKVSGSGPLSRKAASAALRALGGSPVHGAAELGRVRPQLRQPAAQAEADQAIDAVAAHLGIPRAEFDELVVPDHGLGADGTRTVVLGDHVAVLSVGPAGTAALGFRTTSGRTLKGVPAAVRRGHGEALAELKQAVKDVSGMVAAQRMRVERLLLTDPDWTLGTWRDRYPDHGLVGTIARRLIWSFGEGAEQVEATVVDGVLVSVDGDPLDLPDATPVRLWHPAEAAPEVVRAWRLFLESRGISQPFKQAHREVYLLTDAEQATATYSNRFAGHVLRQHQFSALARARGWRYALQGAYDTPDEQAELVLDDLGIRARLWVERPWDDDLDPIVNDAGIFTYVLTDQITFARHRPAAPDDDADDDPWWDDRHGEEERLTLTEIRPRVLSEVLRDVDLYVGVTSIGNDPDWYARGDRRDALDRYWRTYAFGDLSASAETRKDVLERLLPKLAIASVARIDGRFLRVRGTRREYKIHLGSGNILMEPNDQYLCIVPASGDRGSGVFLPFEGDRGFDLILSKAMLLAADDQITDATILSQL